MAKTVVGVFKDRASADGAVQDLRDQGFPRESLRLVVTANAAHGHAGLDPVGTGSGAPASLKIDGVPETDAALYWESVRGGSVLVAATAVDARAEEAVEVFNRRGAVEIERRALGAGRGMSPPSGDADVQTGRQRSEGGGARVFIW